MSKYCTGKIYKIECDGVDKVYIGSTTQPLCRRMANHKKMFKMYNEGSTKLYYASYDVLKYDNAKITLIEDFPCERKDQLVARERYHILQHARSVNKALPKDENNEGMVHRFRDKNNGLIKTIARRKNQKKKDDTYVEATIFYIRKLFY